MAISQNDPESSVNSGESETFYMRFPRRFAPRNDMTEGSLTRSKLLQSTLRELFCIVPSGLIPESVKKLEKLFIAPRARQILHETAQRAFARCECA